jgi:hypothetical protein
MKFGKLLGMAMGLLFPKEEFFGNINNRCFLSKVKKSVVKANISKETINKTITVIITLVVAIQSTSLFIYLLT